MKAVAQFAFSFIGNPEPQLMGWSCLYSERVSILSQPDLETLPQTCLQILNPIKLVIKINNHTSTPENPA